MTQAPSFLARITLAPDGSLVITAWDSHNQSVEHRFTPGQLLPLKDWLKAPATWANPQGVSVPFGRNYRSLSLSYSHESGKLRAFKPLSTKAQQFDPNSEEDLAKLVRLTKSLADPPARSPKEIVEALPSVTAEDLRTKRQVFKEAMPAAGAKRPKKRKPAVIAKPSLKDEAAYKKLDDLLLAAFAP